MSKIGGTAEVCFRPIVRDEGLFFISEVLTMREMMLRLQEAAMKAILESEDIDSLEALRVRYLGKKGELTGILRQMGKLSAEERPQMGQLANQLRAEIEETIEKRRSDLNEAMLAMKMVQETVDVSLPGEQFKLGHKHPMYNALDQIKDIFIALGFTIVDGPEVELSDYNFTKLNIDEGHPSRECRQSRAGAAHKPPGYPGLPEQNWQNRK